MEAPRRGGEQRKILITGGDGFVGRHLVRALLRCFAPAEIVVGAMRHDGGRAEVRTVLLDVTDGPQVARVIAKELPSHIVHLAAIATVARAENCTEEAWSVNVGGALNVALAIASRSPRCRLLYCSSAEVYGGGSLGSMIDESTPINPRNMYGASKAAADLLIGQMARNIRAVRVRPFNHTGVGQSEQYVVPAFAAQVARIELSQQPPIIEVGDLSAERDILDVRDVVDAYVRIIQRFDEIDSGAVINICSGRAVSIKSILEKLMSFSTKQIEVRRDESRVRSSEIPRSFGDPSRAEAILAWHPKTSMDVTLRDVYEWFLSANMSETQRTKG